MLILFMIYHLILKKIKLGDRILSKLGLRAKTRDNNDAWRKMVKNTKINNPEITVGIVGKYFATGDFSLGDSYISVIEAIKHAAAFNKIKVNIEWINSEEIEKKGTGSLKKLDGIIVPQGWGSRGSGR